MALNLTTIKPENLIAKHTSGRTLRPASIKDIGNGQYSYAFLKSWDQTDIGVWSVELDENHKVLNDRGLGIEAKKIAEFTVDIAQVAQYVIVIPWTALTSDPRVVYTTDTTITANVNDDIFIDKEGNIQMPAGSVDGAEVRLFDRHRKIKAGKNNLLLGTSDRWLLADGTYDTTDLTFTDNQLLGGYLTLKYSKPTKSWSGYAVYGSPVQVSGGPSTGLKPARVTGDTVLTANPFDLIHLKGTGNIQIGTFGNLEYFDIQWDGTHDVTVLRPTGFTIHEIDDDLQLDTAQMSVKSVRLTLDGTNFEVS